MRWILLLISLLVLMAVLFCCLGDRAALFERAKDAAANVREWFFPDNLERLRRGTVTAEELEEGRGVVRATNSATAGGRRQP